MSRGVLAGYPLVDVKVTLNDGSYHDVDSSQFSFEACGSMAFKNAALEAGAVILEPIMAVEIGRRSLDKQIQPTADELEEKCKDAAKGA